MRIAVHSCYSDAISELAELTSMNHWQYCHRWNYDYHPQKIDYADAAKIGLSPVRELLNWYDVVLCVGADVLFMNQRVQIKSLLNMGDSVVMAREAHGWWPINNDVVIYANSMASRAFCDRITADAGIWSKYQWMWQTHVWNLIQTDQEISEAIRLVHPKVMNCTPFAGESRWQLGDFIIHFMGLPIADKVNLAKHYLQYAGEPTHYK